MFAVFHPSYWEGTSIIPMSSLIDTFSAAHGVEHNHLTWNVEGS
jgi:hypothetical protein